MERYVVAFFAVGCGLALAVVVFRRFWTHPSRTRSFFINSACAVFPIAFLLVALDAYYYTQLETDGWGVTLSHKRWVKQFWGPINSLGYRDREWPETKPEGVRIAAMVGDSFVSGAGVRDYQDRSSNTLERELGGDWLVLNLATSGWDTLDEIAAVRACPLKLDLIVLNYYLNDILHVKETEDARVIPPVIEPAFLRYVAEHSYLINHWYWRIRWQIGKNFQRAFWESLTQYFEEGEVWRQHKEALESFIAYTVDEGIELIVVIIPHPLALKESDAIHAKVEAVFAEAGVHVVDLLDFWRDRDPLSLMCSPADGHNNVAAHREIGKIVSETIKSRLIR